MVNSARARTSMEMWFFASLEACASCGARINPDGLTFYGSGDAWSLTGWCPHCRGPLTFRFLTHGDPLEGICPVGELGTGPSLVIAPSRFIAEIERLSPTVTLDPSWLPIDAWKLNRDTNRRVLVCLAELAKFIPAGAEEIPLERLGPADVADRAARPERYQRTWVERLIGRHRTLVAAIRADLPRIEAIETELARGRPKGIGYLDRDALIAHETWVRRGRTGEGRLVLVDAAHDGMNLGRGLELAGVWMHDVKLTRVHLEDATLVDAELDHVRFEGGVLYRSRLHRARLNACSFTAADLRQVEFTDARIVGTRFDQSTLGRSTWGGARVTASHFTACNLGQAKLDGGTFTGCDFSGADFSATDPQRPPTTRARFEDCDLRNTRWQGRDLSGARFIRCQFAGAQGQPARTDGVVIEGPDATALLAAWGPPSVGAGTGVSGRAAPSSSRGQTPDELARRLADVIARPTDPSPRRAYADAVRTMDPERAELIDCQLALRAALRANEDAPSALRQRVTLRTHRRGAAWAGAIAPMTIGMTYFGGFVEHVAVHADRLAQAGHALPTLAPIRHLGLTQMHGRVGEFLGLPPSFLRALVSLDLSKNKLDDAEVIAIVTCPDLANVAVLDLARNPITEACLRAIQLPALRYVETASTGAELVEVGGEDWGGTPPSRHFRSLRGRLAAALGDVAWLRDVEPPHLDTL